MSKCLYCYKEITETTFKQFEFHKACSQKIFGKPIPPILDYTHDDMLKLAEQIVQSQKTVTGVQPKLSLGKEKLKSKTAVEKLTIVGVWGEYILKPQSEVYSQLPEIEHLTMKLAELSKIKTVKHTLIRLKTREMAYITKRVDRHKDRKFHMEDMCQLTERLTEHKYKGSHEQVSKVIKTFSVNPGLDVVNFYELVLFCFLTGNNDMHLKNFSLLKAEDLTYSLCPAYDLVASSLVIEGDDEELALHLNGKKKRIKKIDFVTAMQLTGINEKAIDNIFKKFSNLIPKWHELINLSFLSEDLKVQYHSIIKERVEQVGI